MPLPSPRLTWLCQNTFTRWCHPRCPRQLDCGTHPVCPKLPASVSLHRVLLCLRPSSHGAPGCARASRPRSRPAGASAPTPARPGPAAPGLGAGPESAPARGGSRGARPLPVSPCELPSSSSPICLAGHPHSSPRGCRGGSVCVWGGAHTCPPVPQSRCWMTSCSPTRCSCPPSASCSSCTSNILGRPGGHEGGHEGG